MTETINPFTTSEEHQAFRRTVRDFIDRETTREMDRELDATGQFPYELAKKMADAGFYGIPFPTEYGGQGGSASKSFVILGDELAYGSEAAAACFLMPVFFAGQMIVLNGSEEQKREYLPEIISGNVRGCFALTEPNAGSDAASITTKAELDGDEYVVNGQKALISGVDVADYIMLVCRTGPPEPKPYSNMTILMVDTSLPGIEVRPIEKVGSKAVGLFEIFFTDVRVPKHMVIGDGSPGNGWAQMWMSLDMERIMVATLYTAIARKAFDDALDYAKKREQFGQPIGHFQAIQHQLAGMKIKVDAAELMSYRAAWLKDQNLPCSMEGAEAKTFATEIALQVCLDGMQVLGGWGYTMEYDMQRYTRSVMLGPIGMGTNHIQKTIVAKLLGLF